MNSSSSTNISLGQDTIVSAGTIIEDGVSIGHRVIAVGDGIQIRANARIDSGCIISENVTIGTCAWIRAGSVVLYSVPANAIVEGNPAQVTGYQAFESKNIPKQTTLIDYHAIDGRQARPSKIDLEVGRSALYFMRQIGDPRGFLTVGEVPAEVPFSPKRYFAVYNVPSQELRGEHAHKECEQFLLCLHGSCRVLLDDGKKRCEVILDRPDMGVYMPPMIWGTQYRYSSDAVLLVLASMPYSAEDYIRTYDEFITEAEGAND
jgi:dTDP-4-dehydrorhamnose 3,5-epimerase-like enzyme